ncbi:MAG: hypothetical protein ACPK85_11600 [Methanosarcina sp.]
MTDEHLTITQKEYYDFIDRLKNEGNKDTKDNFLKLLEILLIADKNLYSDIIEADPEDLINIRDDIKEKIPRGTLAITTDPHILLSNIEIALVTLKLFASINPSININVIEYVYGNLDAFNLQIYNFIKDIAQDSIKDVVTYYIIKMWDKTR